MDVPQRSESPLRSQVVPAGNRGHGRIIDPLLETSDHEIGEEGNVILGEPDDRACGLNRRVLLQLTQHIGKHRIVRRIDLEHYDPAPGEVLAGTDDPGADPLSSSLN